MTSRPPRVVMLVDNTVDGDSRVQKSARRMAELGWDVTLLGTSPTDKEVTSALGPATVLRVPTTLPIKTRRRKSPGRTLRHPLAYPDRDAHAAAMARAAWRHLDLQTLLATSHGPGTLLARLVAKGQRVVHRTRSRQYRAASRAATRPRSWAGVPLRRRSRQWSYDDPFLADLEVTLAPALARLAPDLVHAHDFRSIGIAVRYKQRRSKGGKPGPPVVYDAHEFLPGIGIADARRRRGDEVYEALHVRDADAVITVSEDLADLLVERHRLGRRPLVVLNCPEAAAAPTRKELRSDLGLDPAVPLLAYCGVAAERRGLDILVEGLVHLPDAHVALVTKPNAYVEALQQRAAALGVADRLHVRGYVLPEEVPGYLASATLGVSPLRSTTNHELALPTKLFEYAAAGLPVVTSDVRTSARLVRDAGLGEVFEAGDVTSYVAAVRAVLADRERYRAALAERVAQEWTWEAQSAPVDALYRELLGRGPSEEVLRLAAVERSLQEGTAPATSDVQAAAAHLLAEADAAATPGEAATVAARAAAVLFHRTLHFDGDTSPLAADPDGYLAGWHASSTVSAAARRLCAPRPAPPVSGVALLSYVNMNFLPPVERALASLGLPSHRVDLLQVAPGQVPLTPARQLQARLEAPQDLAWSDAVDAALGDADAVWVEWGQLAAVAASMLPDRSRRCIVRLHSFEAFTLYPHLVDWSAVDDLVFVGPHIRDLVVPRLKGFDPATTRTHVIPVSLETARWWRPKRDGAERTLAVIGWSAPAKDAVWALDLLARLRAEDPSYRLLLVGEAPAADGPAGARRYAAAVQARLAHPDVAGAVELVPFTSDVPRLLEDVGVVVSSSVRESLHMAVVEGAASGAVPVVRDWPMLAAFDGPGRIYPEEWVVPDLEHAARRVLSLPGGEALDQLRRSVADEAALRFDDQAVLPLVRKVLDV